MSNRCPSCEKFVSLEGQDPELELGIEGDAVTGTCRVVLACAECSIEAKEANFDIDLSIDHDCGREEDDFELVSEDAELTDRYQDKDRHGKPIKSMRYQKHFYGAEITVIVKCLHCGEQITLNETVEEQASGFDETW